METVAIGIVRSAFGIKGETRITSYSGETEHFYNLKSVFLKTRFSVTEYEIEWIKTGNRGLVCKFKGVDSIGEAEKLKNAELLVSPKYAAKKNSTDEFYISELCGCNVLHDDEKIGTVKSIYDGIASDLLEIRLQSGEIKLVPFVEAFIGTVDIEDGNIELKETWVLD